MTNQPSSAPEPSPNTPPPGEKDTFKDRFNQTLDRIKANEQLGKLTSFAATNTRDSIAYVLLIIGIVLLFFHPFYGGLLIGVIGGFYFSAELLAFLKSVNNLIDEQGIVRSLIAGGILLGLFISQPGIFIGMAVAIAIRQIFFPEKENPA